VKLTDLLDRRSLSLGQICSLGLDLARAISASHWQGQTRGPIGIADIEILTDGSGKFTDQAGLGRINPAASGDAARRHDVAHLARLLLRIAQRDALGDKASYPQFKAFLSTIIENPILPGDFAIELAQRFPAEPIDVLTHQKLPTWLIPSLLGIFALASWGLAIGLLVGVWADRPNLLAAT